MRSRRSIPAACERFIFS